MNLVLAGRGRNGMNPWRVFNEVDRVLGSAGRNCRAEVSKTDTQWAPLVDVAETADAYELEADLPGLTPQDIELVIENDVVTLRGERKGRVEAQGVDTRRRERRFGKFERSFRVPQEVDASKAEAVFKEGVLRIHLPKVAAAKPRRIEVSVH